MTPIVVALAAAGAAWGLVADRIAARWPVHDAEIAEDGSVVRPAGWVRPVDWRTLVVALVSGASLAVVGSRYPEPAAALLFGAFATACALMLATDLDQRLLPDLLTLPVIPVAVVAALAGWNPLVGPGDLPLTAVVAIAVPAVLFVASIPFGAGAFGLGDVKFLAGAGLLAGVGPFLAGVVAGVLLAGVVLLVLLALRRITLRTYVPYGPFLIVGILWGILVAGPA
jgi:leader peptidase (prepilin peptidase)/N-methyltransferase